MSRIGRQPIAVPKDVKVEIKGKVVSIQGPGGTLSLEADPLVEVRCQDDKIIVNRLSEKKHAKSLHGTTRALLNNMVIGVTSGYKRELEIVGIGYKAQMKGNNLLLQIGFSHQIEMNVPTDVKVSTPAPNRVVVEGIGKQAVGQFASQVRKMYPPEPYKGKGIRYAGEFVRKKIGKAMAK